ncbi:MAG: FHA domain-containing protein [Cyclobacteriaceae bacterium]
MKKIILLTALFITLSGERVFAQEDAEVIPVDSIMTNPGKYNNEFVMIRGQVTQYTPGGAQTAGSYMVQGDYGSPISVTTMDSKPEVFELYEVSGTVVIDPYTQQPYIIEKYKEQVNGTGLNNPVVLFLIFGGFLIMAILIIILSVRTGIIGGSNSAGKGVASAASGDENRIGYDNEFQTIRIPAYEQKTMKFIPGKLVVTAGLDKGKEFMISGYPSPKGNIVSIGRESVTGERAYSHIQLTEKTVSRKQAEIIQSDGKIYLRNLSETNFTSLDGDELPPEQEREIVSDSVIRMGELEFKYVV